jgi:hypothetical protein
MFVNLKIDKINEILIVHKFLNTNQLQAKQTYIEKLFFQLASSRSLLEELNVILCSRSVVYFSICIYTNLMNICIINLLF